MLAPTNYPSDFRVRQRRATAGAPDLDQKQDRQEHVDHQAPLQDGRVVAAEGEDDIRQQQFLDPKPWASRLRSASPDAPLPLVQVESRSAGAAQSKRPHSPVPCTNTRIAASVHSTTCLPYLPDGVATSGDRRQCGLPCSGVKRHSSRHQPSGYAAWNTVTGRPAGRNRPQEESDGQQAGTDHQDKHADQGSHYYREPSLRSSTGRIPQAGDGQRL